MKPWLIYTIVAAFMFGLGAAMQKHGMSTEFPKISLKGFIGDIPKIVKTLASNRLWLGGCVLGPIGGAFLFQAMAEGKVSVIQPLMNLAMLVTIFAGVLVLKERLKQIEWIAIAILLAGAVLLSTVSADISGNTIDVFRLWMLMIGVAVIGGVMVMTMLLASGFVTVEFVMSMLAGFGFGLGVTFIKLLTLEATIKFGTFNVLDTAQWASMIRSGYLYGMVAVELFGFLAFQAALSHGRVSLVSPVTTIASILVPVAAGALVLDESIGLLQGAGIAIVIVGTAMLAGHEDKTEKPALSEAEQEV